MKQLSKLFIAGIMIISFSTAIIVAYPSNSSSSVHTHLYTINHIEHPKEVQDLVSQIRNLGYNQTMYLHINSFGGVVVSSYEIVNAIKNTNGKVVAVIDGAAYSAAAFIAASCHEVEVSPYSIVMIHAPFMLKRSIMGNEKIRDKTDIELCIMDEHLKQALTGILTQEEINAVFDENKDLWLTGQQFKEKFDNAKKRF